MSKGSEWDDVEKKYSEEEKPLTYKQRKPLGIHKKYFLVIAAILLIAATAYFVYPYISDPSALSNLLGPLFQGSKYENKEDLLSLAEQTYRYCKESNFFESCIAVLYDDVGYCNRMHDEPQKASCEQEYYVMKEITSGNYVKLCDISGFAEEDESLCQCVLSGRHDCDLSSLSGRNAYQGVLLSYYNMNESHCLNTGNETAQEECLVLFTYLKAYDAGNPEACYEFESLSASHFYKCVGFMSRNAEYCSNFDCRTLYVSQKANILGDPLVCNEMVLSQEREKCIKSLDYDLAGCVGLYDLGISENEIAFSGYIIYKYNTCLAEKN